MSLSHAPTKRSVMFEMLRHQNLSRQTTQTPVAAQEHVDSQAFLSRALQSWEAPVPATTTVSTRLAPKPRCDHEFFRAVRA